MQLLSKQERRTQLDKQVGQLSNSMLGVLSRHQVAGMQTTFCVTSWQKEAKSQAGYVLGEISEGASRCAGERSANVSGCRAEGHRREAAADEAP